MKSLTFVAGEVDSTVRDKIAEKFGFIGEDPQKVLEILLKQKELSEMFLQCSSPGWAQDYYAELTKIKAPIDCVKEMKSYTRKQQEILNAIQPPIIP
jgi:hypothetical protein